MSDTGSEVAGLSLIQAAALIATREVSPSDLAWAAVTRIAEVEPVLNAFITVLTDDAMQRAHELERVITRGTPLAPLHGIPVALKDNVYMDGFPTTAGSRILREFVPSFDATVTARLEAAGAIVMGKTNMHEFALGATNDNPHYGPTRNPRDPTRITAGSSGGSAAAVAGHEVYAALGTDTGGSIRMPAALTGCVGFRPTAGRVSTRGVIPLAWSLDTVGPIARTVRDAAVLLRVIAGADRDDPASSRLPVPDYTVQGQQPPGTIRIGIVPEYALSRLQPDVEHAFRLALNHFEGLGAELVEVSIPHLDQCSMAEFVIISVEASAYHRQGLREHPEEYGEDVRLALELGELFLATEYVQAQRLRTAVRGGLQKVLREVDAVITPTSPIVATPLGDTRVVIDGRERDLLSTLTRYTALSSLSGFPALSVPCGFSSDGLPVGMQLIGRPFEEGSLFRLGHAYESTTEWHTRPVSL